MVDRLMFFGSGNSDKEMAFPEGPILPETLNPPRWAVRELGREASSKPWYRLARVAPRGAGVLARRIS